MTGFDALLTFLFSNADLFFLVAIGAMFTGMAVGRKSRRAARIVAIVSLCACLPLFVLYAIASAYRPALLTLAITALWGWNCWRAWTQIRRPRPPKPVPRDRLDRRN